MNGPVAARLEERRAAAVDDVDRTAVHSAALAAAVLGWRWSVSLRALRRRGGNFFGAKSSTATAAATALAASQLRGLGVVDQSLLRAWSMSWTCALRSPLAQWLDRGDEREGTIEARDAAVIVADGRDRR